MFVCVLGVIPHVGGKMHKQNPKKIPAQSSKRFVHVVLFFRVVFLLPDQTFEFLRPGPEVSG